MGSYMCSRTRSHTMQCGPSHTTTCTYRFEAEAPWGRNLMLMKMRNEPSNSTLNQPSSRRTWSHCHQTRFWLRIHTSLRRRFYSDFNTVCLLCLSCCLLLV